MPRANHIAPAAALCAAAALFGCDDPPSNRQSSVQSPHMEKYGLRPSNNFLELLEPAVATANTLLRLKTSYVLSNPNAPTGSGIAVLLVSGETLGEREFAFVLPEIRAIVVNASGIPALARTFGVPTKLVDRNGMTSDEKRTVSSLLALALLHEVGHIQQLDERRIVPHEPVELSKVTALASSSRNRELNADYFAGHLLAVSWNLLEQLQRDPLQFIRGKRLTGVEARQIADLHNTVQLALVSIQKRDTLGPISSYSHLDNDLRLLVYWTLARTNGTMADLIEFELTRRRELDKFGQLGSLRAAPPKNNGLPPSKYQGYIDGLKSLDQHVRAGAAQSLRAELRSVPLLPDELLPVLVDSINHRYGETPGVTYILQTYGRRAVPSLIKSLMHADPRVREAAALCLAQMGRSEAKSADAALRKALMDQDRYVRIRARTALGIQATETLEAEDGKK